MGYRVSMRVLDPGPTGGQSVVLASQKRIPLGFQRPVPAAPPVDQYLSSYAAGFGNTSGGGFGRRSTSAVSFMVGKGQGSPKGGGAPERSTSLPRLVPEPESQRSVRLHTGSVRDKHAASQGSEFDTGVFRTKGANATQQRKLLELLGNPDLERMAKEIFNGHGGREQGSLNFKALRSVLFMMHQDMGLELPEETHIERMFKKYDVRTDQTLDFSEFFDLLLAMLRQNAFSRRDVVTREFFVTKSVNKVWNDWEKRKQLGTGSFGTAYLAKNRIGEERVVKAVKKSRVKIPVEDVEREIMVMRQVDHPHIVRLFSWYEDRSRIYLVLEALKGGTLKDVVLEFQKQRKGLKEEWIRECMNQVISALAYCHSLRLIHKDIKDENIMLLNKEGRYEKPFAVVIDLGIAEMFTLADPQGRECGGTPVTMAPEVWQNSFGPKCDVWSLGCVIFELLTGSFPFMATSMNKHAWLRLHKRGPDWSLVKASPPGKNICEEMLTYQEDKRPSMAQLLQHEWFTTAKRELKTVTPAQFLGLQAFAKETQIKRTLLMEIASRLPMDRAQEIVELFESVDVNGDGRLSRKEIKAFFERMDFTDENLIESTFKALDIDGNDELSFTEFAAGVLLLFKDLLEERLEALIEEFDLDRDGIIDTAGARKMMEGVAQALGDSSVKLVEDMISPGSMKYTDLKRRLMGGNSPKQDLSATRTKLSSSSSRSGGTLRRGLANLQR
mmetsp:Transcript_88374/g.248965  ORF Transcript_88374/g.248965 Transcript_88374/m.248965 type:complete len:725 (-) Transcript_88374:79-2253(-)|eukprot:CAMPEP_0117537366 /NCGR_PEP_ID=MMETSP0784-20121206/41926_1 /TAXON_ID=39447 /ORGANISM="" /LENGTH=724 /DNA_ID=CAMNT_0005333947 /DNA_START=51 /DNA_END=2225 /DNA_ORIENTATION=-